MHYNEEEFYSMPKVLIIDDHFDQRELIRFLLEKHTESWEIIEAQNGKQGLDLFLNQSVDAIITDIKMPFITGIEFAEAVRTKNTTIPILFISGFDHFNFVKQAITLEAVNYILKPINPKEFHEQLDKMVLLLTKQEKILQQEQLVDRLIEKEALTKIIHGVSLYELEDSLQMKLTILLSQINYLVIVDLHVKNEPDSLANLKFVETKFPAIELEQGRSVLFLHANSELEAYYKKKTIHEELSARLSFPINTYISEKFTDWLSLSAAYRTLNQSITQLFYDTSTEVNIAIDLPTKDPLSEISYFQQLTHYIQTNQYHILSDHLSKTFQNFQKSAYESPTIVKFFFATVFKHLIDTTNVQQTIWQKTITDILEVNYFSELEPLFLTFLSKLKEREGLIQQNGNEYIREIKEYIFNYYGDELSLDKIAQEINLTPKYLSELFIKEEGIGLSKFIKEFRLSQAKKLLTTTNKRITEISQETGFNNHSYFIKTFRERFKMTPDGYRKSKKR